MSQTAANNLLALMEKILDQSDDRIKQLFILLGIPYKNRSPVSSAGSSRTDKSITLEGALVLRTINLTTKECEPNSKCENQTAMLEVPSIDLCSNSQKGKQKVTGIQTEDCGMMDIVDTKSPNTNGHEKMDVKPYESAYKDNQDSEELKFGHDIKVTITKLSTPRQTLMS